jgi:nucleotide-binding universal stress UspA family protein
VEETSAIDHLKNIVTAFGASLHVVNVSDSKHGKNDPGSQEQHAYLHLFLQDLDVKYHTVENEDVTLALNEFAQQESLDFIITIPKHHNLVEKLFTKSHTEDLIYHTDIPVLCIHD